VLIGKGWTASDGSIDTAGLTVEVGIIRDGDDPGMMRDTLVQTNKVPAIAGQNGTAEAGRVGKLVFILDLLACSPASSVVKTS
jgi:hypothetical protein